MSPYVLIPLLSCIVCCTYIAVLISHDPKDRQGRLTAMLMAGPAYWAFCEVLWNLAPDAESALFWMRASAPGWTFIYPIVIHLFSYTSGRRYAGVRRVVPAIYLTSLLMVGGTWSSDLVFTRAVETSWGWGYEVGRGFFSYHAFCLALTGIAIALWLPVISRSMDPRHGSSMIAGILCPMLVGSTTDATLPMLGIQVPHLGTAAFAGPVGFLLWSHVTRGFALASPEMFSREILATMQDGVALITEAGSVRVCNRAMESLLAVEADRLPGQQIQGFIPDLDLDTSGPQMLEDCRVQPSSGIPIVATVSAMPLGDRRGTPVGLVVVVRDMREVSSLRSRLVTSDRLAAVGQLAAGIAHEINNPLAYVKTNLSLLREHWEVIEKELRAQGASQALCERLSEGEDILCESLQGVDRATGIVRDVREFSHAGSLNRELTDVNEIIERVLRVATPELRHPICIDKQMGALPLIFAAPQQLKQVFLNLFVNAIHAVGERGTVSIRTEPDGKGGVTVHIEDDGCGIAQEELDRIFDPFFTTKPVGKGTGLGLSISYEIVRGHGGQIEVESTPGQGTRLHVHLPQGCEGPLPS